MAKDPARYRCENPACSLGIVGAPGHFTGGSTAQTLNLLTGKPVEEIEAEGAYGDGYCPNCGQLGTVEVE
jgi:hypothetical protein